MTPFIRKTDLTEWREDPPPGATKAIVHYPSGEVSFVEQHYRSDRKEIRVFIERGTPAPRALAAAKGLLDRGHGERV